MPKLKKTKKLKKMQASTRVAPGAGQSAPDLMMRLYVAGSAPNSVLAIANARAICDAHFHSRYALEIVNLLDHPSRALDDGILVTPTLVILMPLPVTRVIGNLNDTDRVLEALVRQ